jgi:hypothetical protein
LNGETTELESELKNILWVFPWRLSLISLAPFFCSLDSFFEPTPQTMLYNALWAHLPAPILSILENIPTREKKRFARFRALTEALGRSLIKEKVAEGQSDGAKDILSILGRKYAPSFICIDDVFRIMAARANESEDARRQLAEDEVLSAITSV